MHYSAHLPWEAVNSPLIDLPSGTERQHLRSYGSRLFEQRSGVRTGCRTQWILIILLSLHPCLVSAAPGFTSSVTGGAHPLSAINDPYDGSIVGDFNTDGSVDVLAYDDAARTGYTFYRNNGSGGFSAIAGSGNPFDGIGVSDIFYSSLTTYVADFDNDGDLDIWDYQGAISNDGVGIYLENTDGSHYTSSLAGGANPLSAINDPAYGVIVGDFDTDGDVDVLAFDDESYASASFYRNDGGGVFSAVSGVDNPFDSIAAADLFYASPSTYVADFDNDGDLDIWDYIGSMANDGVSIYLENTTGRSYTSSLTGGAHPLTAVLDLSFSIITGDFDSDGDVDVVGYDGSDHVFHQNDGAGNFAAVSGVDSPFDALISSHTFLYYYSIFTSVADFDSDGDADIWERIETTPDDGVTIYLEQTGAPPVVTGSIPADDATGFDPSADLVLDFSENISAGSGQIVLRDYVTDMASASFDVSGGEVSVSGSQVTIDPAGDLANGSHYYIEIQPGALLDADNTTVLDLAPALSANGYYGAFKENLDFTTNSLPLLGGIFTTAGSVDDNATITPFSGVTLSDSDGNDVTVAISYSAANGTLSGVGLNGSPGSYSLSAADTTTQTSRLQALVFTPTANQVAPTGTVTSDFTLTPNDGIGDGLSDATTRITATSVNDPPVIGGTPQTSVSGHAVYSFTPTAYDADGDPLLFTIANPPVWAVFDSATGTLSGTPGNADTGSVTGILITVSDGTASASLSFDLSVSENLDIDGDGMPNGWELDNGFDPADPNDAAGDLDGDGVSNLEEYLTAGDPARDDNPPILTPPADVTVDAAGLFTPVALGQASAYDELDGSLSASANPPSHLTPGLHHITWRACDAAGNCASAVQRVSVNPQVSFSMDQASAEGSAVSVRVMLNGEAAVYPVSVPYVVTGSAAMDGSDHDLVDGTAVIASGLETVIDFNTVDDGPGEGAEQIVITMHNPTNAVAGPNSVHTIELLEGNLAPRVSLSAEQGGVRVRTVLIDKGVVRIGADLTDSNSGDSHSFDWTGTDSRLSDIDSAADTYTFNPDILDPGLYTIVLHVSDGDATAFAELDLNLIPTAPSLSATLDSDGDGSADATEGISDGDNDGVDDYLDAIVHGNVLQQQSALSGSHLIESEPGNRLSLGPLALQTRNGGASISIDDIERYSGVDTEAGYVFSGGLFDFVIEEISVAGQSVRVVLPQLGAIPENPTYRNTNSGVWQSFIIDAANSVASAPGEPGYCPPPGDDVYSPGLSPGHWCVELTIQDGGPNDIDGSANHVIADTGGIARRPSSQVDEKENGNGGGGGSGILTLIALVVWCVQMHYSVLRRLLNTECRYWIIRSGLNYL